MRKALVVGTLVLVTMWGQPAGASHGPTLTETGTIDFPNPASLVTGGVTEILGDCMEDSDFQDLDGHWIDVGGFGGHAASLTPGESSTDVDAYFYTAGCAFIEGSSMAAGSFGENESGQIPSNAGFVIVDYFASTAPGPGSFTFTAS